jgi:hypothetical protein
LVEFEDTLADKLDLTKEPKQDNQIAKPCAILAEFESTLAEQLGSAKEPEEDEICVPLITGAENKLRSSTSYRLGPSGKETVDQVIDQQGRRLADAKGPQVIWPVFLVKRSSEWRSVVDALNQSIVSDASLLPPRTDGRLERVNQTAEIELRHYVGVPPNDRAEHVDII